MMSFSFHQIFLKIFFNFFSSSDFKETGRRLDYIYSVFGYFVLSLVCDNPFVLTGCKDKHTSSVYANFSFTFFNKNFRLDLKPFIQRHLN
jgi:hypothetical protein